MLLAIEAIGAGATLAYLCIESNKTGNLNAATLPLIMGFSAMWFLFWPAMWLGRGFNVWER